MYTGGYADWVVGFLGMWSKWLLGNKNKWGWAINTLSGLAWASIIWEHKLWGLAIPTFAHTIIAIRNFRKWRREEHLCLNLAVAKGETQGC